MTIQQPYVTDDAHGDDWHLMLGDSCERLAELDGDSVDLSVYSPPFASLFTYSPSPRDLGNSHGRAEFLEHYGFIVREVMRVTKPGRISAVHVQQISTTKATHGIIGMTDFRGEVIRAHQAEGWIFHGEVTVDKDPQAQAIRTKAQALMFATLHRDSAMTRPAFADYVLLFRKPGENAAPIRSDVDNETWIEWARPIWHAGESDRDDTILATAGLQRCWYGIKETATLNTGVAKDHADERHICPLQLPLIERIVRLWSNEGETVLSPFAGIGSEGYEAILRGRRFVGCELKPSYWRTAVANLREAERLRDLPTLLDEVATS